MKSTFFISKKISFFDDYKVSEWVNSWKFWAEQTETKTLTPKKSHFQSGLLRKFNYYLTQTLYSHLKKVNLFGVKTLFSQVSECHNSLRLSLSVWESTESGFWDQKRVVFSTNYTVWKILPNKTSILYSHKKKYPFLI